jgi:hypothetical protein
MRRYIYRLFPIYYRAAAALACNGQARERKASFCEQKEAKKLFYAGPWLVADNAHAPA